MYGSTAEITGNLILNNPGTDMSHAVRADRSISTGAGLTGGGNLTANRTLSLDTTYLNNNYLSKASAPYVAVDTTGSTEYPRFVVKNSGAGTPDWIRMSSNSHGLLPYSNGNSHLGTASWKFQAVHAVNFYENGTLLSSKYSLATHNHDTRYSLTTHNHDGTYAAASHNHDSTYLKLTGGTISGSLTLTGTTSGIDFNRSRTSLSKIYWNASATVDYGLIFNVDGTNAFTLYNPGSGNAHLMNGELRIKHPTQNYNTTFGWGRTNLNNFNIVNDSGTVSVNNREVYTKALEIKWGTAAPSGGTNGDIYIQYV